MERSESEVILKLMGWLEGRCSMAEEEADVVEAFDEMNYSDLLSKAATYAEVLVYLGKLLNRKDADELN